MDENFNKRILDYVSGILEASSISRGFSGILEEVSYRYDASDRGAQARISHAWRSAVWYHIDEIVKQSGKGIPERSEFIEFGDNYEVI